MTDIWMDVDTAIAEAPVNVMPLIDDTDFKTIEAAVAYNAAGMALIWHFVTAAGVMTETAVTPTTAGLHDWTDQGTSGLYALEIPASGGTINNDTEGFGWFTGSATGVLPWRGPIIGFRAAALNNALIDGGDELDVNVTKVADTAQTGNDNGADINTLLTRIVGTLAAGTHNPASAAQIAVLSDLIDGGRLDLILDIIAADTTTDIPALIATAQADLDIITGTTGALLDGTATSAQLVDDVLDEDVTGHTTNNTLGKIIKGINEGWLSAEGSVNDVSATTTGFVTDLTDANDSFYSNAILVFVTGSLKGQSRPIITYNGTTKAVTFDEALTAAPANTDQFIILNGHTHPITEIQAGLATEAKQDIIDTNVDAILVDTGTTLPALLPTALVGGKMDANVGAISGDTAAADNLEASLETLVLGTATGTPTTTTMADSALTEATDDHYNGRIIIWRTGALAGQATDILSYNGTTKTFTFTATTNAATAGDAYVVV